MVLIDSSVWIEYFRGNEIVLPLNKLLDSNSLCINDLILAELIPSIQHRKESNLLALLYTVSRINLDINWNRIIQMQTINLKNGFNKIGISDLVIMQNAIENNIELYSIDNHFTQISNLHGLKLYNK